MFDYENDDDDDETAGKANLLEFRLQPASAGKLKRFN
jgi:hypothetical protein